MSQVFVEYRVKPEERQRFLSWAGRLASREKRVYVYEGTDQPNLFVEMWDGLSYEEFEALKARRFGTGDKVDRELAALSQFVEGGDAKIHIWHFRKVE